ncbi:hypothetical protein [Paenibacillus tianjinensis]|uniref:Uncharacterized protein n=1 Tax=Paenibacillus tianjinensis TaxID=2810347 RepID=A0ABX7L5H7_9BACL|nr:hypothetical protein [Paenibacillus tianjinensis]QSF43298.1 hypothetical protein JRJ22_18700 [Paenibacillus tianjinensis]
MVLSNETQKNIEVLKSNISQLNSLKQKNLDHYHSVSQSIQNKRIEAIQNVWLEYLDIRKYVSPLINLFTILLPKEYLNIINKLHEEDKLRLKSLDERVVPNGLDTTPFLYNLEIQRPLLGEVIYFKFRSSILILYRLRLMYSDMVKKSEIYLWNEDSLLLDHVDVVFSTDTLSLGEVPLILDSPLKLLQLIGAIELELNRTIERVISGEVSAELSLERVKKLNQGYR